MKKQERGKGIPVPSQLLRYAKYKWEFLRRNPKYIKEYKKYKRSPTCRETDENFFKKWKIRAISPGASYENFERLARKHEPIESDELHYYGMPVEHLALHKGGIDTLRWFYDSMFSELDENRSFRIVDGWAYEPQMEKDGRGFIQYVPDRIPETGKLTIEVDLRYAKRRLIKDFEYLITEWKELYELAYKSLLFRKFCEEKNIRSYPPEDSAIREFDKLYQSKLKDRDKLFEKKLHFDNFDDYLKVYDLRKQGVSWAEITKDLNLNSIQTARNYYKAACELIEKGVDLYVK